MRPREPRETGEQDLYRSRLDRITSDAFEALARDRLAVFGAQFGSVYSDGPGCPPLPSRLGDANVLVARPVSVHVRLLLKVVNGHGG